MSLRNRHQTKKSGFLSRIRQSARRRRRQRDQGRRLFAEPLESRVLLNADFGEVAKLIASDAAAGDNFGFSVSVSNDTAIVGAYHDADAGTDSGSAYVFT